MMRRIKTQDQALQAREELRGCHADMFGGDSSVETRERAELLTFLLEDFEMRQVSAKELTGGDVLAMELERLGWTQAQGGRELGLARQRVTQILQGKSALPKRVAARLVELGARPELVLKGLLDKGPRSTSGGGS